MGILETIGIVTTRASLAFLVFTFGVLASSLSKRLVKKVLRKVEANEKLALINYPYDIENIASVATFYLVYITTMILTFWLLGIASVVMVLLLLAFAMALAFSLASFAKDFLPNAYGWYRLKSEGKVKVGSKINLLKVSGVVKKIRFVDTIIISQSGDLLHVPNVLFWKK